VRGFKMWTEKSAPARLMALALATAKWLGRDDESSEVRGFKMWTEKSSPARTMALVLATAKWLGRDDETSVDVTAGCTIRKSRNLHLVAS
jgi:hypothetical protein